LAEFIIIADNFQVKKSNNIIVFLLYLPAESGCFHMINYSGYLVRFDNGVDKRNDVQSNFNRPFSSAKCENINR
jgi:hypothetical protein